MNTTIMQIRVIGATGYTQAVLADTARRARLLLGDGHTYRTHTRPARRTGHVRAYLTITRKETIE